MTDIIGTDEADTITGTTKADMIDGAGGDDVIDGSGGADTIQGGDGADSIWGGTGADMISGGNGDDVLHSGAKGGYGSHEGGNWLDGGAGDDQLWLNPGDTADGGAGTDTFWLSFAKSGLAGATFDMRGLDKHGGVTIVGTEISGIEHGYLEATIGDDIILVGKADIRANGGDGNDQITVRGAAAAYGGDGDDLIKGSAKDNSFGGGAGNDTLIGGGGRDRLFGGQGDDLLAAGKGAAYLQGDGGADVLSVKDTATLSGGDGGDRFNILSLKAIGSLIADLDSRDVIDLHKIDADTTKAGNQKFVLVDAFDGHAGEAVWEVVGGNTFLRVDVDGDGAADGSLTVTGDHATFDNLVL